MSKTALLIDTIIKPEQFIFIAKIDLRRSFNNMVNKDCRVSRSSEDSAGNLVHVFPVNENMTAIIIKF